LKKKKKILNKSFLLDGFLFKKFIVDLVIALNILLCKFVDAVVHTDTNKVDSTNVANMIKIVKAAKTTTQVFLDTIHSISSTEELTVVELL